MGDANVRRPVATRFEHGVDFGLLVHKSPFMADKQDPLVLSNYIFGHGAYCVCGVFHGG